VEQETIIENITIYVDFPKDRYISIFSKSNLDIASDLMQFLRLEKSLGNIIYIIDLILSVLGGMAIFKPYLKKEK
jgi:hypothetical protein